MWFISGRDGEPEPIEVVQKDFTKQVREVLVKEGIIDYETAPGENRANRIFLTALRSNTEKSRAAIISAFFKAIITALMTAIGYGIYHWLKKDV